MTNRATLLLIGAGLSLTLGLLPSTLEAQPPMPPLPPPEYPRDPIIPPSYPPPPRPPAWLEFLKNNDFLAPYVFAAAVTLAIAIFIWLPIVVCRGIALGLIHVFRSRRDRDSGAGPRAPPSGDGGRY
jgi:hypothetical protein